LTLLFADGAEKTATPSALYSNYEGVSFPSRGASYLRTGSYGYVQNNTGKRFQCLPAEEHATLIVGEAIYRTVANSLHEYRFRSDAGVTQHVTIFVTTAGTIEARRGTSTGTLLGIASRSVPIGSWHYLEAKVTLSDTVGVVQIWLNDELVLNLSNQDTKNAGTKTVFDSIGSYSNQAVYVDDFYVCNGAGSVNNDALGDVRVYGLFATADGANTGLTPTGSASHYANIDEDDPSTADYNSSAVDDTKDTYVFQDIPTGGTVAGVLVWSYANKSDTGAKSWAPVVRHSSTDYKGTDWAVAQGYAYYKQVYEMNPGTSVAFTPDDVNDAEFGSQVRP